MTENKNIGFVTLAGAGPGDAELITLKLQKRLAEAEVFFTCCKKNTDLICRKERL
jgi:siroheme synthase